MRTVRVAVVDSGVHADHPHIGGRVRGRAFDASGAASADFVDRLGHGTAVAAAILDLAPPVSLTAVKVFDRTLTTSIRALTAGIEWAARDGASLINLSLGVAEPIHAEVMRAAAEASARRGAVIVAAGEHEGVRWLPGTLAGVVRVELDWQCPRGRFSWVRDREAVVFKTCGYPRPIPGVSPERNLKGLSFAVANMTGMAAATMADTGVEGFEALVRALVQRGTR